MTVHSLSYFLPSVNPFRVTGNFLKNGFQVVESTTCKIVNLFHRTVKEHPILTGGAILSCYFFTKVTATDFWNTDDCSAVISNGIKFSHTIAETLVNFAMQRYSAVITHQIFNQTIPAAFECVRSELQMKMQSITSLKRNQTMALFEGLPKEGSGFTGAFPLLLDTFWSSVSQDGTHYGQSGLVNFFDQILGTRMDGMDVDLASDNLNEIIRPYLNQTLSESDIEGILRNYREYSNDESINDILLSFSNLDDAIVSNPPGLNYVDETPFPQVCYDANKVGLISGLAIGGGIVAIIAIVIAGRKIQHYIERREMPKLLQTDENAVL